MSSSNVANLNYNGLAKATASVGQVEAPSMSVKQFQESYVKVAQVNSVSTPEAAAAIQQPNAAASGGNAATSSQAQERARRTLGLDPATAPSTSAGDKILDGLEGLRQVVETQKTAINRYAGSNANPANLVAMQLEVAKYSLLIDVTSKLVGKSIHSIDTLLKSQ
jgi:type III secretion system YscI/HrpB-like protein